MTVTDGDRFAIAMAKLSQARSAVYEATRIIEHLFEADGGHPDMAILRNDTANECVVSFSDPIDGLYQGQKPNITEANEEPDAEGVEECVE